MTQNSSSETPDDRTEPTVSSVAKFLLYGLSIPERAFRSTSAMVGGVLHESTSLLIPQAFRSSKSYKTFVQQMLNFVVKDVGGVTSDGEESDDDTVENYVARKAVGNFIDLAGWATLHVSPATILAIVSDVAYGSQTYLKELSAELKQQGIIDENTTIDRTADLLSAIQAASSRTTEIFDTPPLSVEGMKQTIDQTRAALTNIDPTQVIPRAELERMWNEMHETAEKEHVGVMQVSSTMALFAMSKIGTVGRGAMSGVTVAGNIFERNILQHYSDGLTEIGQKGLYATLAESSQPYIEAVWTNFSTDRETITEDLLTGRMIGRAWTGLRDWFTKV